MRAGGESGWGRAGGGSGWGRAGGGESGWGREGGGSDWGRAGGGSGWGGGGRSSGESGSRGNGVCRHQSEESEAEGRDGRRHKRRGVARERGAAGTGRTAARAGDPRNRLAAGDGEAGGGRRPGRPVAGGCVSSGMGALSGRGAINGERNPSSSDSRSMMRPNRPRLGGWWSAEPGRGPLRQRGQVERPRVNHECRHRL